MKQVEWILDAFHGTTSEAADSIIEAGYLESSGAGHWFGNGIYFSVRDPIFAMRFVEGQIKRRKRQETTDEPISWSVLRSKINMSSIFDLTLTQNKEILSVFGARLLQEIPQSAMEAKQDQIVRELDSLVLNTFKEEQLDAQLNPKYSGVIGISAARNGPVPKGVVPSDGPLYTAHNKASWFDLHDHLQLCIWDKSCIETTEIYFQGEI
ncbi:hypothetical protein [Arthrobacter sp.]|uniref:hypothetical protein n=1 Tax=Arthrobacter sp. TaxID=1667 RepID=UPI003A93AF27